MLSTDFPPYIPMLKVLKELPDWKKMYWTFHYTTAEANFNFPSGHQTSLVTCSGENLLAQGRHGFFPALNYPWDMYFKSHNAWSTIPEYKWTLFCTFLMTISSPCLFICLFVYSCSFHRPSGIMRWCDFAQSTSNRIQSHNSRKIA